MLLRCSLIHITIIILRHFLDLLCLYACLDVGLLISCLCDLFFIFIFISIMINHIISWIQKHLFFGFIFKICPILSWKITWMKNVNNIQIAKFSVRVSICLFFANFILALLIKVLLIKKACNHNEFA